MPRPDAPRPPSSRRDETKRGRSINLLYFDGLEHERDGKNVRSVLRQLA